MKTKDKLDNQNWLKQFFFKNPVRYILFAIILVMIIVSVCFSNYIDRLIYSHLENDKLIFIKGDKAFIHVVSVGEADACVIEMPTGEVCVVDTGTVYTSFKLVNYINDNVINNKKSKKIDYLFYTHADDDHSGGVEALLSNFDVKNIIRPRQYAEFEKSPDVYGEVVNTINYTRIMSAIYEECEKGANLIKAEDGLEFNCGESKIEIFYPLKKYKDSNNYSYYIKFSHKGKSMLFTGDALVDSEKDLLKIHAEDLKCDILKVGHHGGDNSNSIGFLKAVNPKHAVISVGANRLGHPHETVLDNLRNMNCEIYRTDVLGNIVILLDSELRFYSNHIGSTPLRFSYRFIALIGMSIIILTIIIDLIKFIIEKNKLKKLNKMM